jgi:hypothetical protein
MRSPNNLNRDAKTLGTLPIIHTIVATGTEKSGLPCWPKTTGSLDDFAVIVYYSVSDGPQRELDLHTIIIQSQALMQRLYCVFESHPSLQLELPRWIFTSKFETLVHRWDELENVLGSIQQDEGIYTLVKEFREILNAGLQDILTSRVTICKGFISFEYIWTLFRPGELMYLPHVHRAYRVKGVRHTDKKNTLTVTGDYVDWDGTGLFWRERKVIIPSFNDFKRIMDLEAIPIRHHPQKERLLEELSARGTKFQSLAGVHYCQYDGHARMPSGKKLYFSGPVMIDAKSWNFSLLGNRRHIKGTDPLDEDLCTSPGEVPAYRLSHMQWVFIDLDGVKDITPQNLLDQLALQQDTKDLILSMASQSLSSKSMDYQPKRY